MNAQGGNMSSISYRQHIRNVLAVIATAVTAAALLVGWMVYYYSPNSSYRLENVLLNSTILETLSYTDSDPTTGQQTRYRFERIDLSYVDSSSGRWQRDELSIDRYAQIYALLSGDRSELDSDALAMQFDRSALASLTLRVRSSGERSNASQRVFQEVQFLENGDAYRVELHEDSPTLHWAYFRRPQVWSAVKDVLGKGE
jgi:hypothetical protein